jgi:hypothetical protein
MWTLSFFEISIPSIARPWSHCGAHSIQLFRIVKSDIIIFIYLRKTGEQFSWFFGGNWRQRRVTAMTHVC